LEGLVTDAEVFNYQLEAWARPEVTGYDELIDACAVSQFEKTSANRVHELARLSARMDKPPRPAKIAIVASGPAQYGMARMYQTYRELETKGAKAISVFRTMDEALTWLATTNPEVQ
jgi:hypothetical protein